MLKWWLCTSIYLEGCMPSLQFGHSASPYQHRLKVVSTASGHALLEMLWVLDRLMFGGHSLHSSLALGCFPAKICWSRIGAVSAHLFAFTNIWRTRFGATVSAHALSELSWGWNTEFGQVDLWRGFACIDNSLTVFSFFLPNIYRLRVGAVASAYSLLVIPWGWSNGFGQADVWMMFAQHQ